MKNLKWNWTENKGIKVSKIKDIWIKINGIEKECDYRYKSVTHFGKICHYKTTKCVVAKPLVRIKRVRKIVDCI